jgi:hypothetical protein
MLSNELRHLPLSPYSSRSLQACANSCQHLESGKRGVVVVQNKKDMASCGDDPSFRTAGWRSPRGIMLVQLLGRGFAGRNSWIFTLASLGERRPRGNHC